MRRRDYLKSAGAGAVGLLAAGCLQVENGSESGTPTTESGTTDGTADGATTTGTTSEEPPESLTVATYDSFFGSEGTAGRWLKNHWEADHETEIEFTAPSNGINEFIARKQQNADIDADLFVGLNTPDLVRVDQDLPDATLFDHLREDLENDDIKPALEVDPDNRVVAYDTGYITPVYDSTEIENPETFDALLEPEYEGTLLAENAQSSDPGLAFLLWTIHQKGEDGYLDYWEGLLENDVRVLDDWQPAYNAFLNDERPIVVSYSTDQVYYHSEEELPHHQISFLNDEGYANPETVGRFADTDHPETAAEFVDFMLTDTAQANIAVNNVQFPATKSASLPDEYAQYAYEPPEPVTFSYDELVGNLDEWVESWAQLVAGN